MKVIIAGSREEITMVHVLDAISNCNFNITEIVSGTARGADKFGEEYARNNNIPLKQFVPDWDTHGKKAGMLRNIEMGDYADALIAVWNGYSNGTKHMINYMKKLKKPVFMWNINQCDIGILE